MSLELTIYPIQDPYHFNTYPSVCISNVISFAQDYTLFNALKIQNILRPIPDNMSIEIYEAEGSRITTEDHYGNLLTYITAGELKHLHLSSQISWNQAILLFLQALPEMTPIIFDWC